MFLSYEKVKGGNTKRTLIHVLLATHNIALNAFEVHLKFDKNKIKILDTIFHKKLCNSQFLLDTIINTETGNAHAVCGTSDPFVAGKDALPIVSFYVESSDDVAEHVMLGECTKLHIHYGYRRKPALRLSGPIDLGV